MVKILEIINEEFIAPNECLAVIFADSKEELSSEYSVSGLPTGRTLAPGCKFKTADGSEGYLKSDGTIEWVVEPSDLPPVDSSDNGKVLVVEDGQWAVGESPVTPEDIQQAVDNYCEENFSEWAGGLDRGLTQPLMAAPADKVGELNSALSRKTACNVPSGYYPAAYENVAKTRCFKYVNDTLYMYIKNTTVGETSSNEVTTSSASLSVDNDLMFDIKDMDEAVLVFDYSSNFTESSAISIVFRVYKDDLSANRTANFLLDVSNGETVYLDVFSLLKEGKININDYSKVSIRGINYLAHTATEQEAAYVTVYGFKGHPKRFIASSSVSGNPFRFKPKFAHLFINTMADSENNVYVPSQSVYDIEIAKRLGFNVIEGNTHLTSDNKSIVLHGISGKFGTEFKASPTSTYTDAQIQDTEITTVTLDWIKQNVVCRAKYPKLQVPPLTLEEFLYACRKNSMIPLINYKSLEQIEIADSIMGKDNYIFYGAPVYARLYTGCHLNMTGAYTSKAEIVNWVKAVGAPCSVGTSNFDNFTLSEWKEIVDEVHQNGGLMFFTGAYLTNAQAQQLLSIGFDVESSGWSVNTIENGNLADVSGDVGFTDFTIVDGTESNGQLTMNENGTVSFTADTNQVYLSGMCLDITFKGSLSVAMGRWITHGNSVMTYADSTTVHLSCYLLNGIPSFEIKALSDSTIIENIVFKASKF